MTCQETPQTHPDKVYYRQFNPDSQESLALVAKHIPEASRVLDVGCGAGDLGAYLRTQKQCYVAGVDYSADSVSVAAKQLDDVQQLDLNQQLLDECIEGVFDVIVMADILEHIYTPEQTLRAAEKLLKPDGKILISIPNAGYVGALLSLYDDEWCYQEEGILDRTHIRFYTKKSVMALLATSGFSGIICDRVSRDLLDSEFTQRIDSQVNAVRDWLLAKPEGATYQFIVEARPKHQAYPFPSEAPAIPMSLQHVVKCYWRDDEQPFDESQYAIVRGQMGQKNTLRFNVGADTIRALRVDFADRRSLYHLHALSINDGERCLWSSQTADYHLTLNDVFSASDTLPMVAAANGAEANIEVMLAKTIAGERLSIDIMLSAPVDAQNVAFVDAVSLSQYQRAINEQQRLASELARVHAESGAYVAKLEETLEHERQLVRDNNTRFTCEKQQLESANHQLEIHKQQIESDNQRLQTELHTANAQSATIEQTLEQLRSDNESRQHAIDELLHSSSWKLTAPLRKFTSLFK